jgi:hypothetical protein
MVAGLCPGHTEGDGCAPASSTGSGARAQPASLSPASGGAAGGLVSGIFFPKKMIRTMVHTDMEEMRRPDAVGRSNLSICYLKPIYYLLF